jgi:autotransporter-associated beta strand protein
MARENLRSPGRCNVRHTAGKTLIPFLTANGGKLILTNSANSTQGAVTIGAGGTLEVSGSGVLGGSGAYSGSISNGGNLVVASATSQTFSGALSGAGALDKSGDGTLTLSNSNSSYSGEVSVTGGTLKAGAAIAFGTGDISVSTGGTVDLKGNSISNDITSSGGILLNVTSYTGTLGGTVAGTFNAGTDAAKTYLIADTGVTYDILAGQGSFSGGCVTVAGEHNPGNAPGTPGRQIFQNGLSYADGMSVNLLIDANGLLHDSIIVSNGLVVGENVTLNVGIAGIIDYEDPFWDVNRAYSLLVSSGTDGWFQTLNNNISPTFEGVWSVFQDGEGITATWSPIPEPSGLLMVGILAFGAFISRRYQRRTTFRED